MVRILFDDEYGCRRMLRHVYCCAYDVRTNAEAGNIEAEDAALADHRLLQNLTAALIMDGHHP